MIKYNLCFKVKIAGQLVQLLASITANQENAGSLPGPEVIELFSCSSQLNINFFQLINIEIARTIVLFRFKSQPFIQLINVKMPTIVGILTFMRRINFMLS